MYDWGDFTKRWGGFLETGEGFREKWLEELVGWWGLGFFGAWIGVGGAWFGVFGVGFRLDLGCFLVEGDGFMVFLGGKILD